MIKTQRVILYAILSLLIFTKPAFGQGFKAGPLLGLNACQVDGDSLAGYHQTGIVLGAFVNRQLYKNLEWQLEIKYSVKGAKETNMTFEPSFPYYTKSALHYICLPVILSYRIKDWPVAFETGIETGYLFKTVLWDNYGKIDPEDVEPYDDFDFSYLLGVRAYFKEHFFLNIRFLYSIVPFYENEQLQTVALFNRAGLYNNDFSFSLYYQFD
jgi:hypothetical protein